ncbi:oxoglutarate dehydrogenase (succinyl-transferring) [Trichosporon asahii var. asahii CBS 8904]|uniref:2-oxoglutarate dehydrogenase, mitochondrial n=1 Tax=Trichosporon asahii var. asahii (strain CBS 8904) TaxID=1220162 RepID=K1VVL1_TRIAC|nr:oxoglutarate dehydrogenase (succinyl-transferring) [Trichosporon asahii var. asahii CBS 8904]
MLRSIPRALPRVARLNQVRPAALAAYVAQPKAIRAYATEAKAVASSPNDAFANGANQYYIEEMYRNWKNDPKSVHSSWNAYFSGLDKGLPSSQAFQPPPGISSTPGGNPTISLDGQGGELNDYLKVQLLVRAYQVRGHHIAKLDPLGINDADLDGTTPPELKLEYYGWTEADLDKKFKLGPGILPRFVGSVQGDELTLGDIIKELKQMYCTDIGVQYVHISDRGQCDWIRERVEVPTQWKYSTEEKRMILDRTIWSELFEKFIASKYPNEKRFGLEGCESLIPGMKALIDSSVEKGVKSVVIGMPHRGRLNVLGNVIRKPIEAILNEFAGNMDGADNGGGDVKYHLGANYVRPTPSGKKVSLSLVANPSHLEAEDPVVLGKTRAIQHFEGDEGTHDSAMGVLLHGDAAFAGQGVVYESMGLSHLANYGTGGTIHIVVNNQIGFTTDPRFSRSTPYPSDIAKAIDAPIFHVNGDNVEAVNFVCMLAAEWRATFKKDVVVDIVCYRRHGHNETDQPSFTQPRMYKAIQKQPTVLSKYSDQLIKEGTFTAKEIEEHRQWVWGMLEKAFDASKEYTPSPREWLSSSWEGFPSPEELAKEVLPHHPTGVSEEKLKEAGKVISTFPEGFTPHKNLARIIQNRGKTIAEGKGIDWSTAEALAFATLCTEGTHVRVSGQDVERGTFSQRHAVVHDQENESTYTFLKHVSPDQGSFTVSNSHLSEYGTMGFEFGYSLVSPNSLTMWEAQFGDFANNAQCIIDQFLASGERKWFQRTGLVVSLPHGYDGQGPEHSSGRLERFLQLCDDDPRVFPTPEQMERQHQDCNMQIVYPTTPANYFHVLRRQQHRDFRKPLVVFFSKNLLRHPLAKSDLSEFTGDSVFQRYLPEHAPESLVEPEKVRRVVLCSGQVWTQLVTEREKRGIKDVAIVRLEQISPVPYSAIVEDLDRYKNADIMWCQEEPLNNGAWSYIGPRLELALDHTQNHKGKRVGYSGRGPSASVATGSKVAHKREVEAIANDALAA